MTQVVVFDYAGCTFDLAPLEDTYRTLTAVDSAVMVLDAAKGIEPQTLKLFEVCRLRDVPIMTFINKMDPIKTLDQSAGAGRAAHQTGPSAWAGTFAACRICAPIRASCSTPSGRERRGGRPRARRSRPLRDRVPDGELEASTRRWSWSRRAHLLRSRAYRGGRLTPPFFGSALRSFRVRALLDALAEAGASPRTAADHDQDHGARTR